MAGGDEPDAGQGWGAVIRNGMRIFTVAIAIIGLIIIRFSHPEMTETELFIAFWPIYLIFIGGLALSYWALRLHRGNSDEG